MATTVSGCGAPTGGYGIDGIDSTKEAVISGVVTSTAGGPVDGAYVRLLDRSGEFTAEVRTSEQGGFRFFAATGTWTLRALAPGAAPVDHDVVARTGDAVEVTIRV